MTLVYRGDIGARLQITTSNTSFPATATITVVIKKPSGTVLTKTPTYITFTTGLVVYETVEGDLDEVGEYTVQIHGVFDDGDDLWSNTDRFYVNERIS